MSPKLTVITPVFNGARYIEQCLQNVVDQKCVVAEHLIMDGASTDGTAEIVKDWAAKHAHIRLISEKDKGQSDAMNKGIHLAKGEIISFLNVDDYYEENVLNRVLEIFKELRAPAFVCGNLNIWNADGSLKHFNKPDRISLPELASNCFEWPYNPSAYFYHKSLHQKTGPYNVDNHFCMDYEFVMEAAKAVPLRHVDELWGNFVMVADSKTQSTHEDALEKAFAAGEAVRQKAIQSFTPEQHLELSQILAAHKPMLLAEKPVPPTLSQRIIGKLRRVFS